MTEAMGACPGLAPTPFLAASMDLPWHFFSGRGVFCRDECPHLHLSHPLSLSTPPTNLQERREEWRKKEGQTSGPRPPFLLTPPEYPVVRRTRDFPVHASPQNPSVTPKGTVPGTVTSARLRTLPVRNPWSRARIVCRSRGQGGKLACLHNNLDPISSKLDTPGITTLPRTPSVSTCKKKARRCPPRPVPCPTSLIRLFSRRLLWLLLVCDTSPRLEITLRPSLASADILEHVPIRPGAVHCPSIRLISDPGPPR